MDKEKIAAFRQAVVADLMDAALWGEKAVDEVTAKRLVAELSDEELNDGLDWNTPHDVAQLLKESGLEKL